jgi:hypothetical protein
MIEEHREKLFKRFPQLDLMIGTRNIKELPSLIDEVINGTRIVLPEEEELGPEPALPPAPLFRADTDTLETEVLKLAGELDSLGLRTIPEYRRLKLISSLRILDSRLRSALAHLNGGPALLTDRPRPLAGTAPGRSAASGARMANARETAVLAVTGRGGVSSPSKQRA